jgi:hypothetical protein
VIGIADDLRGVRDAYGRIFGDRLQVQEHGLALTVGSARITFLSPAAFAARFAPVGDAIGAISPRLGALRLRTSALARTREVLRANGVPAKEADDRLLIAPEEASGTILEFAAS